MSPSIEFGLLGPLEARVEGRPVVLGGPKQRALLAFLVLHANDVVALDRLIEELWEETPPPSAPAYIQNCVSRLRKELGPMTVETTPPGYRLRAAPEAVDATRFERLVREARSLPTRDRVDVLREALGLWRGEPLSDLAYWSFAQEPVRNLDEQRVNALEQRLEAELELGLHRESIGELEAHAREHPTRERLRWLQMLALHRSDRRLDALAAYQEARLAIVEESGIEPGEELRALHRRILQDDPTLMAGETPAEVTEPAPQLVRKVVAVCIAELHVDESLDLEAARGVVSRALASFEEIARRHGGTVEQLFGEEAVAVFGLPAAHEDDGLRAMRAVSELRDAVTPAGLRAAVEVGEALVGGEGASLSGTAITVARRAKEAAEPAEILLGPSLSALALDAARIEPSATGEWARLIELVAGAATPSRRPDAPLVGRGTELERLVLTTREAAALSGCRRVVVIGDPGIGKTRLVAELVRTIDGEARVLTGRCVPYGDGATYLPLTGILEDIVGAAEVGPGLAALLADVPDGEKAAGRLAQALSGSTAVASGDVFWATRILLEALAREEPVVVVLEDLHWGESTFLDLVEYLLGWSRGAPLTIVCLARTELLDDRPSWRDDALVLRPLPADAAELLLESLPESSALDADGRASVVAVAEGNPLFLEQLAAHAVEAPLSPGDVPPSLDSLLASRLDALGPDEQAVLERASVVGREFTRAAVDALTTDDDKGSTATELMALVRRRLVQPDDRETGEDAFLFEHALVRDAAYASLTKADRARLHEQLARWLDERGELDEIVGHHLEQAVLGRRAAGDDAPSLVVEASDRLGAAGERAIWNDLPAAVALLSRAIDLRGRHDPRRLELECLLSIALRNVGQWRRADELLDDVAQRAADMVDRRLELRSRVEKVMLTVRFTGDPDVSTTIADLQDAVQVCTAEGDLFGLGRAWYAQAFAESSLRGRYAAAAEAASRAADAYERYGLPYAADTLWMDVMADGPTPVSDVVAFCESRLEGDGLPRIQEVMTLVFLVWLWAWVGDFERAHDVLERARSTWHGIAADSLTIAQCEAELELLAGNTEKVEVVASAALAVAASRELHGHQRGFTEQLAAVAVIQRDFERALTLTDEARELALETDVWQACRWRIPRARALAALDRLDEAETLARGTLEMVDATDYMLGRGEARLALADVILSADRREEATLLAEEAATLFDAKGAELLAERARAQVRAIGGGETGDPAPVQQC